MTIRLTRTTHGASPQSTGLVIDDRHATGWQTSGHRVGRFARDLTAGERKALQRDLTHARESIADGDAAAATAPGPPKRPSGAIEQLAADGLPDVAFDPHGSPPPAVADLVRRLLRIRQDLAESPQAAIELAVDGSPLGAQLRHVGTETVAVRMATLTVRATLFGPDSAVVDSVTHHVDASGVQSPVGSGWTLPLADDLGLATPRKGGFLTVTVGSPEVDALGDGVLRPAEFSWMTE